MAGNVIELNESSFNEKIKKGICLIDFFAPWCGPCRMMAPIIEDMASEMKNKVFFGKVNIDKEVKLASEYQVTSIPTLVIFKDGKEINRTVGLRDENALKEAIQKVLNG